MRPVELTVVVSPLIAVPAALLLYAAGAWAAIVSPRVRRRAAATLQKRSRRWARAARGPRP